MHRAAFFAFPWLRWARRAGIVAAAVAPAPHPAGPAAPRPAAAGDGRIVRAYSTLGCPESTLEEALARAHRHGLGGVELRALGGTLDLPAHLAREFGTPAALADRRAGAPARVVALDTSLRLIGGTAADRAKFLEYLPWAEALGAAWLRVFDGGRTAAAAEIREAAATMRWWRQERVARGWRADVMVETHDALSTSAGIRRFLAAVPGAGILWDTHHTWRKAGEDPAATWRAIGPSVVHLHVKDSIGAPGPRLPYTYVLPGEGEFPMAALLGAVRGHFTGVMSLEWEKHWHPELPELDSALAAASARQWW
jgi:sugar phosphate isomerase/epimerase